MEMEICRGCKKLFLYTGYGKKMCFSCRARDDASFEKVKDYINTHGKATKYEIANAIGVSPKKIDEFLRDGRLEIPNDSPIFIKCEKCGCDIRSGRFCSSCAAQLKNSLSGAYLGIVGDKPTKRGTMRFINRERM